MQLLCHLEEKGENQIKRVCFIHARSYKVINTALFVAMNRPGAPPKPVHTLCACPAGYSTSPAHSITLA